MGRKKGSEGGNPTDCVFIAFVRIEVRERARAEEDGCMLAAVA